MLVVPCAIEESRTQFRYCKKEDFILGSVQDEEVVRTVKGVGDVDDVTLLEDGEFSPVVFRGRLLITRVGYTIFLCCNAVNGVVYARKLPKVMEKDLVYEGAISEQTFNRLEVFMIVGVDCAGKTV